MKDYSLKTRLAAVRLYTEQAMVQNAITEVLGIRNPGQVKAWLSQYRESGYILGRGQAVTSMPAGLSTTDVG